MKKLKAIAIKIILASMFLYSIRVYASSVSYGGSKAADRSSRNISGNGSSSVKYNSRDGKRSADKEDGISIIMVGDVLMHDKVIKSGLKEDGSYDYSHLFENIKDEIGKADIAIVNQETILGGEELRYTGYPSFSV